MDLPLFNIGKVFSSKHCHRDAETRDDMHHTFLDHMCMKFGNVIDVSQCEREMEHFSTLV